MSPTKKILALMLALIMLISAFPISAIAASNSTQESESYTVKVTGSTVNIRKGAGTNYSKIGTAKKNATFQYLASAKDSSGRVWYKIQYTSTKTGWITSQYSKRVSTSTSTTVQVVKVTGSTVNVRKGAGTSYGIIGTAKKNTTFTYLDSKKASNGVVWYKIQYSSSKTGWITSQYTKLVKTTTPTTTTVKPTTTTTVKPTTTTEKTTTTTTTTTNVGTSPSDIPAATTTTTKPTTTTPTTKPTAPTPPAPKPPEINPNYNYTLSKGSKGTQVKQMQNRLRTLGYIAEAADGDYGNNTVRSVKAFQKVAGIEVTGVADPLTLTMLYSSSAPKAPVTKDHPDVYKPNYEKNYYIIVYQKNGRVLVLGKDDYGKYNQIIKCFTCSVGLNGKTPNGLYSIDTRYRWRLLFGNVYGQYAVRFYGNYLFHSVPYTKQSPNKLQPGEFEKLGSPASKGCVRLCVRDIKWIYDNATNGTQVRVLGGKNCSVTPEPIPELNNSTTYKGWDPTDPNSNNPYNN